jgi:hypothetical protein
VLSDPHFNVEINGYEPCDTCLAVIHDTAGSFDDRTSVAEDELQEDSVLEAFVLLSADTFPPEEDIE